MGVTCGEEGTGERRDKVRVTQCWGAKPERWIGQIRGWVEHTGWRRIEEGWEKMKERGGKKQAEADSFEKIKKKKKRSKNRVMMQTGNSQWDCRAPACFWLCVKCVSLDTSSIPPEINPWAPHPLNPLPLQSLHPPCLLKCVSVWVWTCVCVCVCARVYVERWSAGPVPRHLQGGNRKDSCVFERNRET